MFVRICQTEVVLILKFNFRSNKKNGYCPFFRPLTKLKSAVKFFVKTLFKLREIWYNVGYRKQRNNGV